MLFLAPSLPRVSFTACDGKVRTEVRASTSNADDLEKMGEMGQAGRGLVPRKSLEEFTVNGMHLLIG